MEKVLTKKTHEDSICVLSNKLITMEEAVTVLEKKELEMYEFGGYDYTVANLYGSEDAAVFYLKFFD